MEKRDSIGDDSTLVSIADTEQTLIAEFDSDIPKPCYFFNLFIELRKKIYRFFCISNVDHTSHPRLWRPTGNDQSRGKIGYFERDTVIPLLSVCRQIHDELTPVLYGENVFAFHVSLLSQGPILFFSWLAPRYVRLLRRVYIRSGFEVDTYDMDCMDDRTRQSNQIHDWELADQKAATNLVASTALVKQAWPRRYDVWVNMTDTCVYSKQDNLGIWMRSEANDWPARSYHLWKMIVADDDGEGFRPEFRRVEMVDGLPKYAESPQPVARSSAGWFDD